MIVLDINISSADMISFFTLFLNVVWNVGLNKVADGKLLDPCWFMSILYADNTFHTHRVMNVNQKHLRMLMMVQVHTSKLCAFVFNLRWTARGPCTSHCAFIWPKGPMMKFQKKKKNARGRELNKLWNAKVSLISS